MRDILEGLYNTDDEKGRQKAAWCSFFFYLFLLASFIISICASVKCTKSYLNKTLFTYKFPMYESATDIPAGVPVSLSVRGYVQRGGGFGIYRNLRFEPDEELRRLKTEVLLNSKVLVAAYSGKLLLITLNGLEAVQDYTYDLPLDRRSQIIEIDHLIKLSESRCLVVGNNEMLPVTIELESTGKTEVPTPVFGQRFILEEAETTAFPHVDTLDNTTVAFIFEKNYQIWAGTATWSGEGKSSQMIKNKVAVANEECIYKFHGVAGMSRDKFIIAAVGHPNNGTEQEHAPGDLRAKVATVASDGSLTFSEWTTRWFTDSSNWFSLDNFNSWQALACYYDGFEGNGVVAINMFLADDRSKVEFGGYVMVENGGASIDYQKIEMRILSEDRFGVFFPDASANGNLIFMMGERTANNELTRIGSNFVVARQARRAREGNFWFSIAPVNSFQFTLLDSYRAKMNDEIVTFSSLSMGYHYAYPVGITTNRGGKEKYIQFNGVYTFPDSSDVVLKPGYTYYTNSQGDLVQGRPYGYNHAEYGTFYVDTGKEICALHNQIGIAVSEKELLIRTY